MLLALRISNFAVIDEAEVTFGPGLTVLTGETGAGKSIVVDALSLALGGRADPDAIRAGLDEAVVEAAFQATPELRARLERLGLPLLDGDVSVRRVVSRQGRGKVHVNGALVTVGVLGELMRGQVDIAGQHEHVSLFQPALHRELLDRHGSLGWMRDTYGVAYRALKAVEEKMESLGGDEKKAQERVELVRYQLEELTQFAPKAGEDAKLEDERRRLAHADKLRRAAADAEGLLSGQDGSALETLGRALKMVADGARLDGALGEIHTALRTAVTELEEGARRMSRYAAAIEADPQRLAEVEDRLDVLRRLCRKHGTDTAGLAEKRKELAAEKASLEHRTRNLEELGAERAAREVDALQAARVLSEARSEASRAFAEEVQGLLQRLAMTGAAFQARVSPSAALGPHGLDDVELYFSANAGEPPKPLLKVASGGEASRVLLALKRALARSEAGCGTYVLDEVDAGVGGAVAEVVGRMIKDVSRHHQVLCVTHLPQVAAFADVHLSVSKSLDKGRTVSRVAALGQAQERTRELARMLSGVVVTREAEVAAEALVRSAGKRARRAA